MMQSWHFVGLLKIELPTRTVRLCDGGLFVWGAETYRAKDDVFGTIASIAPLSEGTGDEVPALELTLAPPSESAPFDLVQPEFQNSRLRLWLAQFNPNTGAISGTPQTLFDGQVDQTSLSVGRGRKELQISVVSKLERLFQRNIGNSLNPSFHKTVWPGETGEDNATGLSRPVAWGVEAPPGTPGAGWGNFGGQYGGGSIAGGGAWWVAER